MATERAARLTQRGMMRRLHKQHQGNDDEIIRAYAMAEHKGQVARVRNGKNTHSLAYARALLQDGRSKGWITGGQDQ